MPVPLKAHVHTDGVLYDCNADDDSRYLSVSDGYNYVGFYNWVGAGYVYCWPSYPAADVELQDVWPADHDHSGWSVIPGLPFRWGCTTMWKPPPTMAVPT